MTDTDVLIRHVYESNAIENIYVSQGDPLFKRHLLAARAVQSKARQGIVMHPLEIHSLLLPDIAGYRTVDVCVGPRMMPPHAEVPQLMESWTRAYEFLLQVIPQNSGDQWAKWIESKAFRLNDWLLCIHPFQDGNGRTARLVMNSFRLCAKQPWYTIYVGDKTHYYTHIRNFEDNVFSRWYPREKWKY